MTWLWVLLGFFGGAVAVLVVVFAALSTIFKQLFHIDGG